MIESKLSNCDSCLDVLRSSQQQYEDGGYFDPDPSYEQQLEDPLDGVCKKN